MDNNIPLTIFWFRRNLRLKMVGNVGGWQWAAGWGTREIAFKIYSGFYISLREF